MEFPQIHGYTILEIIGQGGMSTVYKAAKEESFFAIKVLSNQFSNNTKIRTKFFNEHTLLKEFNHPGIVQVFEFGEVNHQLYIVMEYIYGEDLEGKIEREGPLPVNEVYRVLTELTSILQYIHEHGIIHRDLKPSNILYQPNGKIKLIDFGIARLDKNHGETTEAERVGSLYYMSPEQINGVKILDTRSDIYSLGVLLYKLNIGSLPYENKNATEYEVLNYIVNKPLPSHKKIGFLNKVIQKATNKNKEARFSSCEEIDDYISSNNSKSRKGIYIALTAVFIAIALSLFFMYPFGGNNSDQKNKAEAKVLPEETPTSPEKKSDSDGLKNKDSLDQISNSPKKETKSDEIDEPSPKKETKSDDKVASKEPSHLLALLNKYESLAPNEAALHFIDNTLPYATEIRKYPNALNKFNDQCLRTFNHLEELIEQVDTPIDICNKRNAIERELNKSGVNYDLATSKRIKQNCLNK